MIPTVELLLCSGGISFGLLSQNWTVEDCASKSGLIVTMRPLPEDKIDEAKCIPPRKNCKVHEAILAILADSNLVRFHDSQ